MLILNQASIKLSKGFRDGEENIKLEEKNKAGYTAKTSCGRVGRGVFKLFDLCLRADGRMNGRKKALIELCVGN